MASTDDRNRVTDGDQNSPRESSRGWFEDGEHVLPLRVYYEDTDAAGIVYYANYLKFAERARTEMIRCLGVEHRPLMAGAGVAFAVRSCAAEYLQPARLDDRIVVRTRIDKAGGATLNATQRVFRVDGDDGETELVELKIRLACIDKNQRPARMPADIRKAVAALMAN
ncbi:MAG: tol-pal system-associated acyl-CoA thioesterase [Alphaproteobacteria bacterium]|nr:tol-pal system-associated acyl-CoA thioesterase [Alphaproteobacteria bacterium]